MKPKYIKMKKKVFEKDPMWTTSKQEIADFREVQVSTIEHYLASSNGKGSLVLGKDEKDGLWFRLEGNKRGRKPSVKPTENEVSTKSAYGTKNLTEDEFVKIFQRESSLKKKIITKMIENNLIDSISDGDKQLFPYKNKDATLRMIQKNREKMAEESKSNIIEAQEIEDDKIDPNDPQIGLPVPNVKWTNICKEITYARLRDAGKYGFFNNVDRDLFHAKNVGKGQEKWEFEWPGRPLANKLAKLIMMGGRDSTMMGRAITKLLLDNDYKGMGEKESESDTPPEGDRISKDEFNNLKAIVKKKINDMESNFKNRMNELEILARKTYTIAKENQKNVGYLSTKSSHTSFPETELKHSEASAVADPDWDKL